MLTAYTVSNRHISMILELVCIINLQASSTCGVFYTVPQSLSEINASTFNLILMFVQHNLPTKVPIKNGIIGTLITGEAMLMNQFGKKGVILKKMMQFKRCSLCLFTQKEMVCLFLINSWILKLKIHCILFSNVLFQMRTLAWEIPINFSFQLKIKLMVY